MENILVLTDFSSRARAAAEFSILMARKLGANVILCHALEISDKITYPFADQLTLQNQAMERLKDLGIHLLHLVKEEDASAFCPTVIYINSVHELTEVANKLIGEKSVALTVIGAHKFNGLASLFYGKHTSGILDRLKCPVLLVPEGAGFSGVNTISYATDLTFNNEKVFSYLAKFAKHFDADVSVNHITEWDLPLSDEEAEIELSIKMQIAEKDQDFTYQTHRGDEVSKTLMNICEAYKVDMLCVVHKRYTFLEALFHHSLSKELAHTTKVPLLVMPYYYSLADEVLKDMIKY